MVVQAPVDKNEDAKKPMAFRGRAWVLQRDGRLIDDIDTDMIYHNRYLYITDPAEMGKYALGNLAGYEDFAEKAREGDIIIAGKNFGSGSSRQHAVDCFRSLGISCVLAESFGAIYKRNAINSAFPVLEILEINVFDPSRDDYIGHLDVIEVDVKSGEIKKDGRVVGKIKPMSPVQREIYLAGGLFEYAKKMDSDRGKTHN